MLVFALAALIGLLLGLLGGGGSILTVPVFVYVAGIDAKLAIAASLPVVGLTSLVGAAGHWRAGNVNLRVAALFGLIAMAAAYVGARLSVLVSGATQMAVLAVVMIGAAASMLRSRPATAYVDGVADAGGRSLPLRVLAPAAAGVGVLTGLVGIGGGFLVVPALVVLARLPMKQSVGTSLVVITMNSAAGYVGHRDAAMPWRFVAEFTAVAIAGILVGTATARFVSQHVLRRGFAVFLLATGAFVFYKNRAVFAPTAHGPRPAGASDAVRSPAAAAPATE